MVNIIYLRFQWKKTSVGNVYNYLTKDGKITSQYLLNRGGKAMNETIYLYDSEDNLVGFTYAGNTYFYVRNYMNDIMGITDSEGTWLVKYRYDAWGSMISSEKNDIFTDMRVTGYANSGNSMKYRGYYYDSDVNMYYLQSRYYNLDTFRFLNADLPEYAKEQKDDYAGINLYAYCGNDPVNNSDPKGYKYNPNAAKKYADKWWNTKNRTLYNPLYGKCSGGDCTNFVSACLYAGGLAKMSGTGRNGWHCRRTKYISTNNGPLGVYDRSHAWGGAANLYSWLKKYNYISTTYTIRNRSNVNWVGKKLYNKAYCSAVIFFDWNRSDQPKGINHAALSGQVIHGGKSYDIYYYAHQYDRNGKRYDSNRRRQYTSIKDLYNDSYYKHMIVYVCILR